MISEVRKAAKDRLKPPVIIPVTGAKEDRVVIEFDIVCEASTCKHMIFYYKGAKDKEKLFGLRDGTSSNTHKWKDEPEKWFEKKVIENATKREEEVGLLTSHLYVVLPGLAPWVVFLLITSVHATSTS